MRQTAPARATDRLTALPSVVGLLVVGVAIIGTLASEAPSSSATSSRESNGPGAPGAVPRWTSSAPSIAEFLPVDRGGSPTEADAAVTEDDGALPDGVTVFDDAYPGIANIDSALLQALRDAATDAARDDIQFAVNSGWRSPEYQDQILREAIATYGSEREAARWVATAETSAHVSGDAVDIGSVDAAAWLSEHGARYGLCQVYRNESWHFELRTFAIDRGCPAMYADPAHGDRRTQP